jgi:hypothetical protein
LIIQKIIFIELADCKKADDKGGRIIDLFERELAYLRYVTERPIE